MSTKTTFKRVALVTVAALGLGMLSAMPSSAAAATPTAVTVGTIPTAQVGVVNTTPVTVTFPAGLASDTFSVNVRVTSAPAGSQFRSLTTNLVAGVAATGNTIAAKLTVTQSSTASGLLQSAVALTDSVTVSSTYTSSTATAAAGSASFSINMTPDVAGSYTILVSTHSETSNVIATAGAGNPYTAGDANSSYTVSTGATAASVVLAAVAPSIGIAGASTGMLFKATIKDAAGAVAQLGVNETIGFALTSGAGTVTVVGIASTTGSNTTGNATASATYAATSANFTNGVGYFRFTNTAAETAVITATGTALLSSSVTGTLSFVTKTETTASGAVITDSTAQAAANLLGAGGHSTVTGAYASSASRAAASHAYKVTYGTPATIVDGTTSYDAVNVVDTSGKITGIVLGTYTAAVAISAAVATTLTVGDTAGLSFTATLSTAGNSFTATIGGSTLTVSSAAPVVTAITATPAGPIRQTVGSSTAITAKVTDQFGAAVALSAVNASTTGRNASTSATALVSDASGYVTYTRTDAGTAATVLVQDTVTFTGGSVTDALVINYGTTTVGTITCTSGAELDTTTSVTYRNIDAGDGVEGGAASLCTVTIKDANGAIMVGVPVTVTTASAGAAVVSTSASLYTGSAGTVAPSVYGWTAGAKTFTVTAGTVTSTETINYRQATATSVRSISVVADGNIHRVTAKDRFGNVVPGVRIYGTRTGNGLFGGGTPTANAITADPTVVGSTTGVAEFIFNGGSASSVVTYQVASAADTPSTTYGQTDALAGNVDGGTTPDAFTATVAGTALVAEVGVGASFSAAGVNSVSATIAADTAALDTAQAAVDAAAEATDAANAATDAANAAAEAADAATAAAQDAADAVAALSAQVASLISGLKAQLTALTNLIIKIQRKVKA